MTKSGPSRLLLIELLLAVATAMVFWLFSRSQENALAVLYGSSIVLLITAVSAWRLGRIKADSRGSIVHVYLNIIERFGIVIVMVLVGLKGLALPGPAMITGLAITLLGYWITGLFPDPPQQVD